MHLGPPLASAARPPISPPRAQGHHVSPAQKVSMAGVIVRFETLLFLLGGESQINLRIAPRHTYYLVGGFMTSFSTRRGVMDGKASGAKARGYTNHFSKVKCPTTSILTHACPRHAIRLRLGLGRVRRQVRQSSGQRGDALLGRARRQMHQSGGQRVDALLLLGVVVVVLALLVLLLLAGVLPAGGDEALPQTGG